MKLDYNKYHGLIFADKELLRKNKGLIEATTKMILNSDMPEKTKRREKVGLALGNGIMLNKPIYIVAKSFHESFKENLQKLRALIRENREVVRDAMEEVVFIDPFKNMHIIHRSKKEPNEMIYICAGLVDGGIASCARFSVYYTDIKFFYAEDEQEGPECLGYAIGLLLLKKYAAVELETIEAGKKKKLGNVEHGKVINETGVDVTLLDSSWFREIVRNEGFTVRGHFRLQPCKDENGNWTRKIIYIEEFEKHGYHRRAKITI